MIIQTSNARGKVQWKSGAVPQL